VLYLSVLIYIYCRHKGKVAFVGDVHYAKGIFVGVVMDDPKQGKNSGTVRGVEYFSCPNNRGLMVSAQDIKKA
jgi:dynactin complex subunit